jgi:hypothetical protein
MSLARAQAEFLDAILGVEEPGDAGLAVYRRTALASRRSALAAAYPVVRRLVGAGFFDEVAARHARSVPSASGDLNAYGAGFAGFLEGYAPARSLEYLPDMARLEWAVHECAHAADGADFDFAALGRMPADALEGIVMRLHPAARFVASFHPVLAIWEANQEGCDGTPGRDQGPDHVLVRRLGFAVAPVALDIASWELAQAFACGATLGQAADALGPGRHLEAALSRLGALGALGGFEHAARG